MIFKYRRIDIFNLNYNYSEKFNLLELVPKELKPKEGIFWGTFFFMRGLIKNFFTHKKIKSLKKSNILFFAPSINNYNSLHKIYSYYNDSIIISNQKNEDAYYFPKWKAYLYSIIYLPFLLNHYYRSIGYQRKSIKTWFQIYWLTYGYYKLVNITLNKINPNLVVLSNDHTMSSRCFLLLAKELNIKSLYIQHASVNDTHPLLEFDYAFLDGLETIEEYKKAGNIYSNVFLTGASRFHSISNDKKTINKIPILGIAYNILDKENLISKLIDELLNYNNQFKITIRPHPAEKNFYYFKEKYSNDEHIIFSDSRIEKATDFLNKIDILISNNSSIHLESAYKGIPSIIYSLLSTSKANDQYGYLSMGLVKEANSFSELVHFLENKKELPHQIISYFLADYGTDYYGKVSFLHHDIIEWIINNKELPKGLVKKTEHNLSYYQIS